LELELELEALRDEDQFQVQIFVLLVCMHSRFAIAPVGGLEAAASCTTSIRTFRTQHPGCSSPAEVRETCPACSSQAEAPDAGSRGDCRRSRGHRKFCFVFSVSFFCIG
jgi:hypothetical protein